VQRLETKGSCRWGDEKRYKRRVRVRKARETRNGRDKKRQTQVVEGEKGCEGKRG
jgi:hypothetical protein